MSNRDVSPSERLATELAELLVRHGAGGGWVVVLRDFGSDRARIVVVDAESQRSFAIAVEERHA